MGKDSHEVVSSGLKQHLARLWRYSLVLSGNREAAEDLVQATCLRALDQAHQLEPGSPVDRWLFSIMNSSWKDELRSQSIRPEADATGAPDGLVGSAVGEGDANAAAVKVLREMQELPEVQRITLFLVYGEGFSYQDAAETLNVPVGTIMSRLASARAKLGQLAEDEAEPARAKGRRI